MSQDLRNLCLGIVLGALATSTDAQFQQYTPPGTFEEQRESREDLLDRSMREARWRWGRAFLHPWVGIRDVAFVDPVVRGNDTEESDFTATVGVGIRAYVPVNSELTVAVHALPEYVWWQDLSDRRRINGRYGVGVFGNLGRTGLEVSATRVEDATFISREIEQKSNTRDETGRAAVEVDIGAGFSIFGEGSTRQLRFLPTGEAAALSSLNGLEREEELLRAGVRVLLPRGLTLGLGVESSEVDFTRNEDRSNSGTSPTLQLDYADDRFSLAINMAFRDLEPEPGSRFVPYDQPTGTLRVAWRLAGATQLQLFADRNLAYAVQDRWAYFEDTGLGIGVKISLGSRVSLRVFAVEGENEYTSFVPTSPERIDDFEALGGELRIGIARFTLTLGASTTDYDSNFSEFDRSTTVIHSGLTLGLSGGSPWG